MLLMKLPLQMLGEKIVEIITAESIIAVAGKDLRHIALDGDNRNIKGTAAQVVDHHGAGRAVAKTIGQAGGRWLIQNADHLQPGDHSRLARRIALGIREVRRNSDHGAFYRLAQFTARPFGRVENYSTSA